MKCRVCFQQSWLKILFWCWRNSLHTLRPPIFWEMYNYITCSPLDPLQWMGAVMDLFLTDMQLFTSQDINWWTGVMRVTCGLLSCFIRCLDSHSDGTHSLQSIHWWTSDVMLHAHLLIYVLDGLRVSEYCFNSTEIIQFIFKYVHLAIN